MGLRFSTGIGPIRYSTSLTGSRRRGSGGGGSLIQMFVELLVLTAKASIYAMYYLFVWPIQKGAPLVAASYRQSEISKAGQPYWNRHPVVSAWAVLLAVAAVIAYWFITIPVLVIAGTYFVVAGRRRHHVEENARLIAAADDSMLDTS